MDNENKDLGTQGTEDTVKGKLKQAAGNVQKNVGKLTGDKSTEAKGSTKETEGKVQSTGGQIERKADETLDNLSH